MHPSILSALALVAGVGLGLLHFWGLWYTLRYLPRVRQPGLVTLGSTLGRIALSGVGMYLVMRTGWPYLLLCLGGFLGARTCLLQRWRPQFHPGRGESEERYGDHPNQS